MWGFSSSNIYYNWLRLSICRHLWLHDGLHDWLDGNLRSSGSLLLAAAVAADDDQDDDEDDTTNDTTNNGTIDVSGGTNYAAKLVKGAAECISSWICQWSCGWCSWISKRWCRWCKGRGTQVGLAIVGGLVGGAVLGIGVGPCKRCQRRWDTAWQWAQAWTQGVVIITWGVVVWWLQVSLFGLCSSFDKASSMNSWRLLILLCLI